MKSAVHAALGDEQDASAQGKDSTSDVEDGGADAAGGGEGVGDDFFVVESGLTVEVGQGDGLFVFTKVFQITGLRADGYAILLQFQLNLLNGVGRGLCGTTGCRGALYHDADRVERGILFVGALNRVLDQIVSIICSDIIVNRLKGNFAVSLK